MRPGGGHNPLAMRILAALLLCCLLLPPLAAAHEDDDPAAKKPPQQETEDAAKIRADRDKIAAGVIGRGLVSPDDAVRKKAVDRLLARLEEGGDLAGFLRRMGDAVRAWANQHERLMEVWIDQAVNGTGEERDRAVLLLTALGQKAVRRLALELRHRGHHAPQQDAGSPVAAGEKSKDQADRKSKSGSKTAQPTDEVASEDEGAEERPTGTPEIAAGLPRNYDVADLLKRGFTRWRLSNLLRKEADAVSVKEYAAGYIVTATEKGHEALRVHLATWRAQLDAAASNEPAPGQAKGPDDDARAKKPAAPPETSKQDAQAESAQEGAATAAPVGKPRVTPRPGPILLNRSAPQWQITPLILHLPQGGLLEARLSAEGSQLDRRSPLRSDSDVILGSVADAKRWAAQARKVPDARVELPWEGPSLIAMNTPVRLFAGKKIRYSKEVRQSAGGAWRILTGTIRHGIELELRLTREAKGLRVVLKAEHTEVGLPLPVVTIRPSPRAAPVELEQPQWSITRSSNSFLLAPEGGGAFLPLTGLGSGPDDHLVLVLSVEGYRPQPQQAGTKNAK